MPKMVIVEWIWWLQCFLWRWKSDEAQIMPKWCCSTNRMRYWPPQRVKGLQPTSMCTGFVNLICETWLIQTFCNLFWNIVHLQACPVWSSWSEYNECSVSCGNGTQIKTRTCDNGDPGDIGCHVGGTTAQRSCNGEVSFLDTEKMFEPHLYTQKIFFL